MESVSYILQPVQNNDQTEVLVVGAGPVGMLTALLLKRQGVATRIMDQKYRTAVHSYACALHPASLCILEQAGIVDDVIGLGRRLDTIGLYDGAERRAQIKLADLPSYHPFVMVLGQFLLEELLEEELHAAGVQIEWRRRLRKIEQGANGIEATIENVTAAERGDPNPEFEDIAPDSFQLHAHFVVGADGKNSLVRQQLGIGLIQAGSPEIYGVYEIETVEPVDNEMKLVANDAGISVLWPLSNNKCRWSFQIAPPESAADTLLNDDDRPIIIEPPTERNSIHHLRHFLAERAPWFQHEIKDILWIARAQFERQLADHFGRGRCWLAGDAAHQTSPAGMQSMNLGLREAADLADKLKHILRDGSGLDSLLSYDHVHRVEWERILGLTAPSEPPNHLSPWARRQYPVISGNLPASGDDLQYLLQKL